MNQSRISISMVMYYKGILTIITIIIYHSNDCLLVLKYGQIVDVEIELGFGDFPGLETAQLLLCVSEHLLQRVPSHWVIPTT